MLQASLGRDFVRMRWGLVPSWWPKPLKDLKAATFNPALKRLRTSRSFGMPSDEPAASLIPASGYYEWQDTATGKQPWYFTPTDARFRLDNPWREFQFSDSLSEPDKVLRQE
jgi:putative SOS response-associated peptidase YedK